MMIKIGETFTTSLVLDKKIITDFSKFSGDINPIHLDEKEAKKFGFNKPVAHGAIIISQISKLIGNEVPGPGALWLSQDISWLNPIFIDDKITLTMKVAHFSKAHRIMTIETNAYKENKIHVMKGEAKVQISKISSNEVINIKPKKKLMVQKKESKILIVGGNGKLGSSITEKLSREGHSIILTYSRNKKNALLLKKNINQKYKKNIEIMKLDLNSNFENELTKLSKINIQVFIHCAMNKITEIDLKNLDQETFQKDWEFSCKSTLDICKAIIPNMIEGKFGRLIFLGTSAMKDDAPKGWSSYLMNKHALWGLTKSLSQELAANGITSNMVSPSLILSELTQDVPQRVRELMAIKNPLGRLATPEDVSNVVSFLTKKDSEYINGQNIFVNGG